MMKKIQLQDLPAKQAPASTGTPVQVIFRYMAPQHAAPKATRN